MTVIKQKENDDCINKTLQCLTAIEMCTNVQYVCVQALSECQWCIIKYMTLELDSGKKVNKTVLMFDMFFDILNKHHQLTAIPNVQITNSSDSSCSI